MSPIKILQHLISRNKNTFILPLITINETIKIIKNMKSTHSTGHDLLTSYIIKKIPNELAPHITHLINRSISTSIYPDILKVSKIFPILKPNKDMHEIDSFRPINNLPVIDKNFSEHIKHHLMIFLDNNNIIDINHHGGREGHSTTTAIINVYDKIQTSWENNKISATVVTDLKSAYETISHLHLKSKVEHYGIRGD